MEKQIIFSFSHDNFKSVFIKVVKMSLTGNGQLVICTIIPKAVQVDFVENLYDDRPAENVQSSIEPTISSFFCVWHSHQIKSLSRIGISGLQRFKCI